MNALTVGVLVATVSVIFGSPMPQYGNANGNRYGNNNNNYPQQQQQYTTAAASGYTTQQAYQYPTTQQASYAKPAAAPSYQPQSYNGPQAQLYQGRYNGQCQADGFYYNDQTSLVLCTNGNAYVQPCARGSQNADASQYTVGVDSYVSFCNINLVDSGAGASSYGSSSSNSYNNNYGSSSSSSYNTGYTQKQTYAPIYPQQPSVVTYPAPQSYQPASYPQQPSGSY